MLALLILSAVLVIAFGVSALMLGELKLSQDVPKSLKAYYAAEAGVERILYDVRQLGSASDIGTYPYCSQGEPGVECLPADSEACYAVDYDDSGGLVTIKSAGCYRGVRRAIEISY